MGGVIRNLKTLATTPAREKLLAILEAGYEAIDIQRVIKQTVERRGSEVRLAHEVINTALFDRLLLAGFGKASAAAMAGIEEILGDLVTGGVVIDVKPPEKSLGKVNFFAGTHPLPSEKNHEATRALVKMLEEAGERDLIIMFISGGGSALLCLPDEITCEEEVVITELLTHKGAAIQELNTVRKHISRVRGGNLARYAYPASVLALIVSDVPGNDISVIASGPTVLDMTTVTDAEAVLKRYGLEGKVKLAETPKKPRYFEKVRNIVILENTAALRGMEQRARTLGLFPIICTDCLRGEARTAARILLANIAPGQAMLAAGETIVKVTGQGEGGRNKEFVLGALEYLAEHDVIASVASDGWDNGESAGAIADFSTLQQAAALGLKPADFLNNNDSQNFFKQVGGLILTGRLNSNVSDFMAALRLGG